jgi:hypothetical protein
MALISSKHLEDRRREPRIHVDMPARVYPGAVSCMVCDRSSGGARLRFAHSVVLPQTVIVVFWHSGQAFEAQVVWRKGADAGLKFLRSADLNGMVPSAFAAVKAAWRAGG